jgi:hypothetical protein
MGTRRNKVIAVISGLAIAGALSIGAVALAGGTSSSTTTPPVMSRTATAAHTNDDGTPDQGPGDHATQGMNGMMSNTQDDQSGSTSGPSVNSGSGSTSDDGMGDDQGDDDQPGAADASHQDSDDGTADQGSGDAPAHA